MGGNEMKPSEKSPELESFLEYALGQTTAIKNNRCIAPPIGCGFPIGEFSDKLSLREYKISGLCQRCQSEIFGDRQAVGDTHHRVDDRT